MRSGELASDRRCYREVGGADCRCGGFRDSGEVAVALGRPRTGRSVLMSGLLALVLVVMGLGLLYAYRAQTPAVQTVPVTQAITEINAGRVTRVTITGTTATLDLHTGETRQTVLPERPEAFQKVLDDYNAANPSRRITIDYQPETSGFQVVFSILLSLLPVLLLGAFFLYLTSRLRWR